MKRNKIAVVAAGVAVAFGASTGASIGAPTRAPTGAGVQSVQASNTPELFIKSATQLDPVAETVSLPLYRGRTASGQNTWYVITESSNIKDAERRGVNPAPKLANALGTKAVQKVARKNGVIHFAGTPDFSPKRVVVPSSPNGFPPDVANPGAVGDAAYSPLITTGNGVVLSASQVKNASGVHDSLVSINWTTHRVTMRLFKGFYNGKSIIYLKFEASLPLLAAIESTTFAPNLNAAPGIASDEPETSAREAIIPAVNGPRGVNNPQRQGLQSALLGQGDPLNIIQEEPGDTRYSPVWDVSPYVWTKAAIAAGERHRLRGAGEVRDEFSDGNIVSAGFSKGPHNDSLNGLRAAGFISLCPVVALLG